MYKPHHFHNPSNRRPRPFCVGGNMSTSATYQVGVELLLVGGITQTLDDGGRTGGGPRRCGSAGVRIEPKAGELGPTLCAINGPNWRNPPLRDCVGQLVSCRPTASLFVGVSLVLRNLRLRTLVVGSEPGLQRPPGEQDRTRLLGYRAVPSPSSWFNGAITSPSAA